MTLNPFARLRTRRRAALAHRIDVLERDLGIVELSAPDHPKLPKVTVRYDPGEFEWSRWRATGFPGMGTYAGSKHECVRLAKKRLRQMADALDEPPVDVTL